MQQLWSNAYQLHDRKRMMKSQMGVWQFYYEKRDIRDKTLLLQSKPPHFDEPVLHQI